MTLAVRIVVIGSNTELFGHLVCAGGRAFLITGWKLHAMGIMQNSTTV
jgi:hypothetical protein